MASSKLRSGKARSGVRLRLLQSASVLSVIAALGPLPAQAQLAALRGAAHVSATGTGTPSIAVPVVPGLATSPAASAAVARSLQNASRAQQAVNLALQAQAAARQTASALSRTVPNGLAPGGLVPVANPLPAANDPTGLSTWQGAAAPTQSTGSDGGVVVNVAQTASRAILDWQSFNIGAGATLNFDQSLNGTAQPSWVVLNRVVGQIDPATGLRDPSLAPAPSQILGAIKAQGTVLLINQNGILFGPNAKVDTNSLIVSSLEIGGQAVALTTFKGIPTAGLANAQSGEASTLAQRDNLFLVNGVLGPGPTLSAQATTTIDEDENGVPTGLTSASEPNLEGAVTVEAGAQITAGAGGSIIIAAPTITNAGELTATQGQISLVSGRIVTLTASSGVAGNGNNPNIRGLSISTNDTDAFSNGLNFTTGSVTNSPTGLIQSSEGYASLTTSAAGSVTNAGTITATTSVSRNGFIQLSGQTVTLAPSSVIAITPDDSGTIPQDPNSLADFKPSQISIGALSTTGAIAPGGIIDIGAGSLIYAPGANIDIGATPGPALGLAISPVAAPQVLIDSNAVIDASGLKNVAVSGASLQVTIDPVTANDTSDTPSQRSTLDHTTVTVDPRLSGVRSDGVVWVGSPLIPAQAFAEQIGVSASQLMTKGGDIVIGSVGSSASNNDVLIKPGAVIDVSGGWITYQAGMVQTTNLVTPSGAIVNIADASPDQTYLGVYNGFVASQPRYGLNTTYANPLLAGGGYQAAYSQGADAGALTIEASHPDLQGVLYAAAFTGPVQALSAQVGAATSSVYGDQRALQAAGSQLPAGGLLFIQGGAGGGLPGDIEITGAGGASLSQDATGAPPGLLTLSAPALSALGLGQLSLYAQNNLSVDASAAVTLAPGGVFAGLTGHAITIDGSITAPSGSIVLQTGAFSTSVPTAPGQFDIAVNGRLSAAGLWTNDFGASGAAQGPGYINGGSVSLTVPTRQDLLGSNSGADIVTVDATQAGTSPTTTTDVSGSILIDGRNSLVDVSAGGYVAPNGALTLTAKGGSVTLTDPTVYFPFYLGENGTTGLRATGFTPGFRVNGINEVPFGPSSGIDVLAVNPASINAVVAIGDNAIHGYGFTGGVFNLTTPALSFSDAPATTGSNLPLDFFSKSGFATYNITSYATALTPNTFSNGLGGYNAVLATQVLTVQAGQTLNLTQSGYSNHLTGDQIGALRALPSGAALSSVLTPTIQPDAYDQQAVSLNLGGLIEFKVAQGGLVTGAAGAELSAAQIYNQGTIRLPGGTLSQTASLPAGYAGYDEFGPTTVFSAPSLAAIFSANPDGTIDENAASRINPAQTNAQVAAGDYIYLTGDLPASTGMDLAPGSVTDLSGAVLVNPYISATTQGRQVVSGQITDGGALTTAASSLPNGVITAPIYLQPGLRLIAQAGAQVNLAGASATFDQLTESGQYISAPQWSDGGALTLGSGGTLTGAIIDAHGGAPQAAGGVLTTRNLTLTAIDPVSATADTLSAAAIQAAGFGSLVVQGDLKTGGGDPVDLTLPQAFYLTGAPVGSVYAPVNPVTGQALDSSLFPTVSVSGVLQINAPYIALDGAFQTLANPPSPSTGATGEVTLNAQALDVTGAVYFNQAVADVTLHASADLRLIGAAPYLTGGTGLPPSLAGQLAVNGDLTLAAAQVYATTGSSFLVTSASPTGVLTLAAVGATPATPYSAGSNLVIQAANIVQDGVLRAPIGTLTLGGNAPLGAFAPATSSLTLGAGSVTSVAADGLSIPYGTTTDQTEYFFSPTNANPLTAPPAAVLTLSGRTIDTAPGATVDLKGGGDLFAYEFVPGTGGSRDVLSQFNTDAFTSNDGYQYADHRQVYAIAPGLSDAAVAAYDPIYSSNYAPLYGPGSVGQRVYLNAGPGVAAGWRTLLPAQYALLPGGMEIVEDTSVSNVPVGSSAVLNDGSVVVTGAFGGLGGTVQSTEHVFDIKSQAVINAYSNIVLTSGDQAFTAKAAANDLATPRLPSDAARLIANPLLAVTLGGEFLTAPANGARGSEIDITGGQIAIADQAGSPTPGVVQLSADQLTGLNAASLLIGGVRTDNPDQTTSLAIDASQITLANDAAHPLSAPTILLATDGSGASIALQDGSAITASGVDSAAQTGAYLITGGNGTQTAQGALVAISAAAPRLVTRVSPNTAASSGALTVGAANLSGASILLDSSGQVNLTANPTLTATAVALDSSSITFAPSAQGLGGLVITPLLSASLAASALTLRSTNVIGFADGAYQFAALSVNAPGVDVTSDAGLVSISAKAVALQNSGPDAGGCLAGGLACGSGQFVIDSQSLTFANGTFRIYGAGQGVTLAAPHGMMFQGQGALDVGAAPLTLETAFLGDQVSPDAKIGVPTSPPSLTISTGGDLTLTNPTAAATPVVSGVPGASLSLDGRMIAVSGVDVRATAGALTLNSAAGVSVGSGATLETPGFSKSFGDAADPFTESAPGGSLTLSAATGDIALQSGSVLSVGGGAGAGGALTLTATQGSVSFNGTLDGATPNGGASFLLDEAGGFDLTRFVAATGGAFNGDVVVQTGLGALDLAAGQSLKAVNVNLTADGGPIDIAGTIDVSGVNGGQVGLFGAGGVTLEAGSLIAATASGYAAADTRQASGGQVSIGVAGASALTIASGAVIDTSALRTTPRIVEGDEGGVITYDYVAADQGGVVNLRAPVSGMDGSETVNVSVAGAIKGASSVVLEGYKAYDLNAIAASGQFSGVSVAGGVATLDTTAVGAPNFLASDAPGTLVHFIQNFGLSASYGALGGLASQANFHARPGVELDYAGAITLASNWNLGAGVVDTSGAAAAGLMVADPGVPGAYSVVQGDEAAVFARFTSLTYRVGGSVLGEPGVLSLRAGGQLTINGSITDGFFTFGDQTDPTYLANATGDGARLMNGVLNALCVGGCATVGAFNPTHSSTNAVSISFPSANALGNTAVAAPANLIPYDAAANSPGALGSGPNGAGDPIGSAEIFPLAPTAAGAAAVNSWSYQLAGGAAINSANPLRVVAGSAGGVTVQNAASYSYGGVKPPASFTNTLLFNVGGQDVTADQWLAAELAADPNLTTASLTNFSFSTAPSAIRSQLEALAANYFSQYPGQFKFTGPTTAPTAVATSLNLASGFLQQVAADWPVLKAGYNPPSGVTPPATTVALAPLIRTGSGAISLAAAGTIDLTNGPPAYAATLGGAFQLGGAAIYSAGTLAIPGVVSAVDTTTGATVSLDPSGIATLDQNIGSVTYGYGAAATAGAAAASAYVQGLAGVLVSNPIYLQGGGDVSLNAGGDVLGRRDAYTEALISNYDQSQAVTAKLNFIGDFNQPWRVGVVDAPGQSVSTNILINPQLFTEGLGALGGGNIQVSAGGRVSDLSLVTDSSVTTGAATGGVVAGQVSQGQLTYGRGDISVTVGGDLLGGRIDIASGAAALAIGGAVASAGPVTLREGVIDDTLRLRLTDATIDLTARGDVDLEGVAALGVQNNTAGQTANVLPNAYAENDYSPQAGVSLVSDGSATLENTGLAILPTGSPTAAVLPGSLTVVGLEGDVNLNLNSQVTDYLVPSPVGTLTIAAGADVTPVILAMLDTAPGATDLFPAVLPTTTIAQLEAEHDPTLPRQSDPVPNRLYAGGDILDVELATPKQTRIGAGRDILNMVFLGQNLNPSDVTRISAGRDITATSPLETAQVAASDGFFVPTTTQQATVQGDTFVLGGPGALIVEAGRNLGPFLTSATITTSQGQASFGGGILTVGDAWNPYLAPVGASIDVEFGVAKGEDFAALTNAYLNPANIASMPDYLFAETLNANNVYVPDRSQPIYAPLLVSFMQTHQAAALLAAYGTTAVSYAQAYSAFVALPTLEQRPFLLQVYFNELSLTSVPGPTFDQYQRGYQAVNLLFPASLGYTANALSGGVNGANTSVQTGDLDLRLATIETQYGGDIDILGPGGRVVAGSTVATAQQAARRYSTAAFLYAGNDGASLLGGGLLSNLQVAQTNVINAIPAGYEGVLTLRGGDISTFTDRDFVLNQSRLFTEQGGDVIMWSSNGDLNAGEGPKTSSDFPPVAVNVDDNAYVTLNQTSSVTGAGIAAFQPAPGAPEPDVFLIAPRGTVDAGAAGVRVAGSLFVAALHVANADNFQVAGTAIGLPPTNTALTVDSSSTNASTAATKAAQQALGRAQQTTAEHSIITVEVLSFGDAPCPDANNPKAACDTP